MNDLTTLDELPVERRLALAYAPAVTRRAWLGFLLLDLRLSRLVAQAREPLLGQMRLAWWRDRLKEPGGTADNGEPILGLLSAWQDRSRLIALVDGWEALLAEPPIEKSAILAFARGRGEGFSALAWELGVGPCAAEATRCGTDWALVDLALGTRDPLELTQVREVITQQNWSASALPRAMRPLAVLYGLARRKQMAGNPIENPVDGLAAIRLGLFGR